MENSRESDIVHIPLANAAVLETGIKCPNTMQLTGFKTAQGTSISVKKESLHYVNNKLTASSSADDVDVSEKSFSSPSINLSKTVSGKPNYTENTRAEVQEDALPSDENVPKVSLKRKKCILNPSPEKATFKTAGGNVIEVSQKSLNHVNKKFKGLLETKDKTGDDETLNPPYELKPLNSLLENQESFLPKVCNNSVPAGNNTELQNVLDTSSNFENKYNKFGSPSQRLCFENDQRHQPQQTTNSCEVLNADIAKYLQHENPLMELCDSSTDQKCALVPIELLKSILDEYSSLKKDLGKSLSPIMPLQGKSITPTSEPLEASETSNSQIKQKLTQHHSNKNSKFFTVKGSTVCCNYDACSIHDLSVPKIPCALRDKKLENAEFQQDQNVKNKAKSFDVFHSFHRLYRCKKANKIISNVTSQEPWNQKYFSGNSNDNQKSLIKIGQSMSCDLLGAAITLSKTIQCNIVTANDTSTSNIRNTKLNDLQKRTFALRDVVQERVPGTYSQDQLLNFDVNLSTLKITSSSARNFEFDPSFFTKSNHTLLAVYFGDMILPVNKNGCVGKDELFRIFVDDSCVKSSLVSAAWFSNHYRWIIWKLASYEISFPHLFARSCLLPHVVIQQMKFRYNYEIYLCKRSALRKIYEHDDTPAKTMVLLISSIKVVSSNGNAGEDLQEGVQMKVSDGWYEMPAEIDAEMQELCRKGRVMEGQKIITSGAQLVGSCGACSPLEVTSDIHLKLHTNSTRLVRWDCKLGYCKNAKPFPVSLSSVLPVGGKIGCIEVAIVRNFGILYKERLHGDFRIRNELLEDYYCRSHNNIRDKHIDEVCTEAIKGFQAKKRLENSALKQRKKEPVPFEALHSGSQIFKVLNASNDPDSLMMSLTCNQLKILEKYKLSCDEQSRQEMEMYLRKAVLDAVDKGLVPPERNVQPFRKLLVRSITDNLSKTFLLLSVWNVDEESCNMFKEGSAIRIYNLFLTKNLDGILLNTTKMSKFEPMTVNRKIIDSIYEHRRVKSLAEIEQSQHLDCFPYVDVVGFVFHIDKFCSPSMVYITNSFLDIVVLRFPSSIKVQMYESVLQVGKMVAACNLKIRKDFGLISTLDVTMFSRFSLDPAGNYIKAALKLLSRRIEDVKGLQKQAQEALELRLNRKR